MPIQLDLIDIGGTHTRVARCESPETGIHPVEMRTYRSKAYPHLEAIIRDYESKTGVRGEYAVIGVAGPVVDGAARATNLPWVVDEARLKKALSGEEAEDITVKAIDIFVSILGAEAGNMALRYNARAGVYIGGGVASKILPFVKKDGFLRSFKTKGRLSGLVSDIPVLLIRKFEANLYGLANYARKTLYLGRQADGDNSRRLPEAAPGEEPRR